MSRLTDTSFESAMENLDAFDLIEWQEEIYNKLAEYENLGDLDFIKELVNAYNNELNDSIVIDYLKTIKQLKHDLAVRDKALELASKELYKKGSFAQYETTRKIVPLNEYFLAQAEKGVGR